MKSTFLNVALLSLLVAAVPVGVSSCKDYDSEITELQQEDQKIKDQISSLQAALNAAQADANAAKALAQQALDQGMTQDAVNQIAAQAAATAKAEAISEAIAQCNELLKGYATKEEVSTLASKIASIDAALNKLGNVEEVAKTISGLETQVKALQDFQKTIEALGLTDATNGFVAIQQLVATMNAEVTDLLNTVNGTADVPGLKQTVANLISQVAAINSNLIVLQGETLYGLVFKPVFYWAGVEALEAKDIEYYSVVVDDKGYTGNLADAIAYPTWNQKVSTVATNVLPDLVAEYHMNPSSAVVPTDLSAYTLNIVDKKHIADPRGAEGKVVKASAKDGLLTVTAALTKANIKDLLADDEMTMLQLQVATKQGAKGDTVISSDYAAIFPAYYTDLQLCFVEKGNPAHTPLYATAQEAITAGKTDAANCIDIAWDDNEGLNIAKLVHTEWTLNNKVLDWDKNAADGVVENYGFSYQFDLVGWANTANGTSESAHAALKAEDLDVYMRAQMVANGKQQAWGAEQNKATIGRMPVVRVFLVDNNSKKNAAVGYMIFNIVPTPEVPEEPVIIPIKPDYTDAWVLSCPFQAFSKKLAWYDVEEQILANFKGGISKEEFETNYIADTKEDGETLNQYVLNSKGQFEPAVKEVGTLYYTTNADDEDYGTNVFGWDITGKELYELFVTNKTKVTTITVYGRFYNKKYEDAVYVSLTYTPSSIKYDITSDFSNDLKISNYWYSAWSNTPGFAEVHQNVKVPNDGETSSACTFVTEVLNWFHKDSQLALTGIDPVFKGLQDANLDKYFNFCNEPYLTVGVSGQTYKIEVQTSAGYNTTSNLVAKRKNLNNSFDANGTVIAVLEFNPINKANFATANLTISYQENDYAKDILSKYNSKLLAKNETAWGEVAVNALNDACGVAVPVTNNKFVVRFLRPVNMYCKDAQPMVDAGTSGSTVKLIDILSFADWRYDNAQSLFSTHAWYYNYYGFQNVAIGELKFNTGTQSLKVDGSTGGDIQQLCYTDLGGAKKELTKVTDKLRLTYIPGSNFANDLGSITYYNNGETVNTAFHIWVPVIVTYKWGWLVPEDTDMPGYVKLTVKPTIGQD